MMKPAKNIPELRFPEFDGEWIERRLAQITSRIGDGLHGTPEYVEESNCFFINGNNLVDGRITISEQTKKVSTTSLEINQKGLNGETLLISINGTIGSLARYNQENVMLGKSVGYLIFHRGSEYYFQYLSTAKIQRHFVNELTGTTIKNLSLKTLRETVVLIPSLPEQQKIATFLSAVDQRIQRLAQKKEKLELYKKGIMQQIFCQQLRFKDENGQEYQEWEELTLDEIRDKNIRWSFTGGPFGSDLKSEEYTQDGVRIIQLQNIGDGRFINDYKIFTSEEKANNLLSSNIFPGDILISKMGDPVARACIVPFERERYLMASDGIRLVPDNTIHDTYFIFLLINHRAFRQKAIALSTGSTRRRIGLNELREIQVQLPSLSEQQKIASFLSSIDQKISLVNQQIELTRKWKQGLLQKMFV